MTHEVFNQVPPLVGHDVAADAALLEGLAREGAGWAAEEIHRLGVLAGTAEAQEWGRLANEYPPVLRTHDRYGHRIDEVEFHPAWHQLMTVAVENGLHAAPWASDRPGAHVARAAKFFIWSQVEAGHGCPISMTYSAVAALRHSPELRAEWEPRLTSCAYDFGLRPPAEKRGILAGMAMTEKQGGSDVRSNTTKAEPLGDGTYALTGHKWFNSAPMCDIFFVLAQAPGGLSCFLLPRVLPDGTRNAMRLIRLKDKLGNRSNASAEVEYEGAIAYLVGEEGRGVRTIIEMVNMTRLDCVIGSAAGMRFGLTQALHHAKHRRVFGKLLIDQPLMRAVLADLALESEAATTLMLRLAGATDRAIRGDEAEALFRRAALAAAKYWVTKRGPVHAAEALECLGGNGYVEDSQMPRLLRESPVNSVWEGSGNVAALDVLRVLARQPEAVEAFFAEVALAGDARITKAADRLRALLASATEADARRIAEEMTLLLQASLLVRHAPAAVADAFCATRLSGEWGRAFGTLPSGLDLEAILERAS
ncbi:isovaleryl-CoA dehydrogenase [Thermobispora bispora]|uniref:Acyl-CoA dehydrogenase domain protein n=1 Tax=Thermobispora bispora (strain ATCC 19993 / DSM 43833 / CBS 139.67 / JCM 10125 / KCTC 9307 / NBRC 14880 / R51) TaxID=469371 RepID=D6Y386_THEBD|nr:isovaleryl-CoA dehydrogenase [Thermobispora bispora]ADG88961.1 acyl-CoA dehydrogenase domain protein [Thermobispora bispora DSM 43833]MBO2474684.1 isovaleryl-CoA dehydrogenase [Actinomycetales bacterium]MBX6169309.1 isovaleryl-CoA dehydrogenase [Thermobispora bispora]QSI48699.1 isovaleryl-CoA dehydrogenase [Thermobispora bispora]